MVNFKIVDVTGWATNNYNTHIKIKINSYGIRSVNKI